MVDLAYSAYHANIPVCQIFAGDISGGAFDDADRFAITTYSSLIFTADNPQYERVQRSFMWKGLLRERPRVFISGATHFDDMEYDDEAVPPKKKYALVLYNPPNMGEIIPQVYADLDAIIAKLENYFNKGIIEVAYWVAPNGDYGSDVVISSAKRYTRQYRVEYLGELPHRKFLGYMKHCDVMIGNSSSMYYEAAFFNRDTLQIGQRNKYREKIASIRCHPGASQKIIGHIREFIGER
jgi:UDP-N-acetylglucosamine 2-epimerase